MNNFEFISHEEFAEDIYVKEVCILRFEGKYDVAYARKPTKEGGLWWGTASIGVQKDGKKKYFDAFSQDSKNLEKQVRDFLENKGWLTSHSSALPRKAEPVHGSIDYGRAMPAANANAGVFEQEVIPF